VAYSNILELQHDLLEARFAEPANLQGYINPNQFAEHEDMPAEDMICVDARDELETVKANAQRLADSYQLIVTVDVTDAEQDLYSDTMNFRPTGWPEKLTVETVAAWIWSKATMPVNAHAILRAFKAQQ
jgi:hypothetical protein